jgi:atypical dual specificity phosphatase
MLFRGEPVTWINQSIVACAYPKTEAAIAALAAQGVSLLINFHTRAHPADRLARHGLAEAHFPTRDFTSPTREDLTRGLVVLKEALAQGRKVAVHCGGGLGRTGTFLACYFVDQGLTAEAAIARIRSLRPESVETSGQEQAVREFEMDLRNKGQPGESSEPTH